MNRLVSTTLLCTALLATSCAQQDAPAPTTTAPAVDAATGDLPPPAASAPDLGPGATAWDGNSAGVATFDHCALDAVNGGKAVDGVFTAPSAGALSFEGWISTPGLGSASGFSLLLRDATGTRGWRVPGTAGIAREDVATALKTPALANAGYKIELAGGAVPTGRYPVLVELDQNGIVYQCDTRMSVQVD